MDDLPDLDSLFRLPLAEFTAARNALAARLTKSGQKDAAARVRSLAKPPVSAWVVNQLYWRERSWFDRLIASGALLRQAQASGFAGQVANLQEPLRAQRDALNELSRRAITFLSQDGHGANPDILRRVTLDLEGLAAREPVPDGPQPGRLTSDVDAPGFEALAALVPKAPASPARGATGGGAPRVLSFIHNRRPAPAAEAKGGGDRREGPRKEQEKARLAAARQALKLAEKELSAARRAAARSEAAMKDAAAQVKTAERVRQQAEKDLEKAVAAADAARLAARRAASDAADAAQALDDAERALAQARARVPD